MTKKDFKLAIIVGTNRTNRQSMLVARLIEKEKIDGDEFDNIFAE